MRGTRIADSFNKVIKCKPWTYGGSVTKLPAVPAEPEEQPMTRRSAAYRAMQNRPPPADGNPLGWDS